MIVASIIRNTSNAKTLVLTKLSNESSNSTSSGVGITGTRLAKNERTLFLDIGQKECYPWEKRNIQVEVHLSSIFLLGSAF